MFKSLLVPLDGSEYSERALAMAAGAGQAHAEPGSLR